MEKKHPNEWEKETGITVLDPDGWRFKYGDLEPQDYSVKITLDEFHQRVLPSTIQMSVETLNKIIADAKTGDWTEDDALRDGGGFTSQEIHDSTYPQ